MLVWGWRATAVKEDIQIGKSPDLSNRESRVAADWMRLFPRCRLSAHGSLWTRGATPRRKALADASSWPFASFRCDAMTCRLSGQSGLSHVVRPSEFYEFTSRLDLEQIGRWRCDCVWRSRHAPRSCGALHRRAKGRRSVGTTSAAAFYWIAVLASRRCLGISSGAGSRSSTTSRG